MMRAASGISCLILTGAQQVPPSSTITRLTGPNLWQHLCNLQSRWVASRKYRGNVSMRSSSPPSRGQKVGVEWSELLAVNMYRTRITNVH
ncbi:hypothetical protein C8Q79DRAFT_976574 [Trametes meyenii]|nr:hypothetical protein C8Q79DRAFT_976574 [Trametes meyenii]